MGENWTEAELQLTEGHSKRDLARLILRHEQRIAELEALLQSTKASAVALRTLSAQQRGDEPTPYEWLRDEFRSFRDAAHVTIAETRREAFERTRDVAAFAAYLGSRDNVKFGALARDKINAIKFEDVFPPAGGQDDD